MSSICFWWSLFACLSVSVSLCLSVSLRYPSVYACPAVFIYLGLSLCIQLSLFTSLFISVYRQSICLLLSIHLNKLANMLIYVNTMNLQSISTYMPTLAHAFIHICLTHTQTYIYAVHTIMQMARNTQANLQTHTHICTQYALYQIRKGHT